MSKFIVIIIAWSLSLPLFSQNSIQWKVVDNNNNQYKFQRIIKTGDHEQKAVFTIPQNKPFKKTKHSIFIRKYNADMSSFSEDGIPAESPNTVAIKGFLDYNVIYGTMDDNVKNQEWMTEPNKVIIADNNMNTLVSQTFPLHSKRNRYETIPEIIISADSNYLIIVNEEMVDAYKVDFKYSNSDYYIDVYDKYLNHVWSDSIIYDKMFPNNNHVFDFNFNYYDNKLVVTAKFENPIWGKPKPIIYVLLYDKPQSYKIIMQKEFTRQQIVYNTLFDKSGKIFFTGYTIHIPAVGNTYAGCPKNQLFYLSKDINSPDVEAIFKCYDLDDDFAVKFPKQKELFGSYYILPQQLICSNNKLYYFNDYVIKTTERYADPMKTYSFGQLFLMSFDKNGNIEWMNSINKRTVINEFENVNIPIGRVILKDNDLNVFYYDNLKNVFSEKLKSQGNTSKGLCIVNAVISSNGGIKKTIISNVEESQVRADLSQTRLLYNNSYLFVGKGATLKNMNDYFGIYTFDK
jgi:hypothetical protein